jgi:alginate O-acetyltransferase complex protein AlgI
LGLFQKASYCDRLAPFVNEAYSYPNDENGIVLLIATYFFAFQIYCDFSGYSDIAIGISRMMGFNLMDNFRVPYFSQNIKSFWARWHISLSTWFRDYLYIPLGGNRASKAKWLRNLMIVFVVSGLWHGANWTFIIWGTLHGVYLVCAILFGEKIKANPNKKSIGVIYKILNICVTFNLVVFAWIFFRADSVEDANIVVSHIFTLKEYSLLALKEYLSSFGMGYSIITIFTLVMFIGADYWIDRSLKNNEQIIAVKFLDVFLFAFILALIILLGAFGNVEFIYFQF